jgi:hypothetical protein
VTARTVDTKGNILGPLDLTWHLLNFFAPALGLAAIAAGLAKLVWRTELRPVPWTRLFAVAAAACMLALIGGLVLLGHDGRMATYAAMVLAAALGLWSVGFGPLRR